MIKASKDSTNMTMVSKYSLRIITVPIKKVYNVYDNSIYINDRIVSLTLNMNLI